jgi:hypothetical protein
MTTASDAPATSRRPSGATAPAVAPARPGGVAPRPRRRRRGATSRTLALAVFAMGWLVLVGLGAEYYQLDMAARLRHPWHVALKPSGPVGLAYGYLGTFFLLLLLAYSVRKRVRWLARLGALRRWLDVHILCGLMGPAFITLHAGFRIHGLVAVGYWSMLTVMTSGFVGYYLYRQIPRRLAVQANESELLRIEIDALDRELGARYGLSAADLEHLRRIAGADRAARMGPFASLAFLVGQDLRFALGLWRLRQTGLRRRGRGETRRLRALVRRRVLVERRRAFLAQSEALFGYWHAFHKPFAIVLYTMMAAHIGIAVWLGYAWAW